jgi:hypothetical protein
MTTVSIPRPILEGIFRECDRYESEETGGRLLGFYTGQRPNLHIQVQALIGAGPNARRSQVSFFQDGEYQERIFRAVEKKHPRIEHLGNWHTHHVNNLRNLSHGDCDTYTRCVNSANHNTAFFYSLLVTHRLPIFEGLQRYGVRHFVFFRGVQGYVELPSSAIDLSGTSILSL